MMPKIRKALPDRLVAEVAGWGLILMVPLLILGTRVDHRIEVVPFAVPALPVSEVTWGREVGAFADKVRLAFGINASDASEFATWILEASARQELDPELLASLVHTESTFRKHARGRRGAVGPAQVKPWVWSDFCGTSNLYDPAENIYCGAQVLSFLRDECGDEVCALRAYNTGLYSNRPSAARRYVTKIDRARDRLRGTEI